jgi:hypothetical protein
MQLKLLFILIPLFSFIHTDDNLIDWSPGRKLTWADFKGTPNPSSPNAALTNSSINVEFGFNGKSMTHSIKCRFNKSLSWGRIKNDYILGHEQGHFDIAEIHARLLHKALSDYSFNAKTVNDDVTKIYNKVIEAHVKFQKSYDLETNHSIDTAQQVVWDKKIDSLLTELKPFSDYR